MDAGHIPSKLEVEERPDGVLVRMTWRGWQAAVFVALAVFWDGAMFAQKIAVDVSLAGIARAAIGLYLFYAALAYLLNRTEFAITSRGVVIATGPIPWRGDASVAADALRDVFVRPRVGSHGLKWYELRYIGTDRQERLLFYGFDRPEQAEFVALKIRKVLAAHRPA